MKKESTFQRFIKISRIISAAQWVYDKIINNYNTIITTFILLGGMSYLASITDWARALGPLGIAAIGLFLTFFLWAGFSLTRYLAALTEIRHTENSIMKKLQDTTFDFNPLSAEFHTKRMRIVDLAHPISKSIKNKRLIDCELIGPSNILFLGKGNLTNVVFIDCEVVVVRDGTGLRNVCAFENVTMIGGSIWNCIFFVTKSGLSPFENLDISITTLTGIKEIDERPLRP